MSDGWPQLDTVRLVLASVVAVGHAGAIFVAPFYHLPVWLSWTFVIATEGAVVTFFLISGLVIGRSLINISKRYDAIFLVFIWRRFMRIYPPLLFSVALCFFFAMTLKLLGRDHYSGPAVDLARDSFSYLDSGRDVLVALTTFGFRGGLTGSSNGPLWSLALEMQAYVFAGLAATLWFHRSIVIRIVVTVLLAALLRFRGISDLTLYHWICIASFGLGLVLNYWKIKLPSLVPIIRLDFSYSLYILHFPVMLFIFFISCSGQPPHLVTVFALAIFALLVSVAISIFSGLAIEIPLKRWRAQTIVAATTPSGYLPRTTDQQLRADKNV